MLNLVLTITVAIAALLTTTLGNWLTLHPPTHVRRKYYQISFVALGVTSGLLTIFLGIRSYRADQRASVKSEEQARVIAGFGPQLERATNAQRADNMVLTAKLEDAYKLNDQLKALGPALLKMAELGEQYTKKQYEAKVLSDQELLTRTQKIVAKTRTLAQACKRAASEINSGFADPLPPDFRSRSTAEQQKFFNDRANREFKISVEQHDLCSSRYQNEIQGEAVFVLHELRLRLPKFTPEGMHSGDLAMRGIFAGPDPIGDSATYLESYAQTLASQAGTIITSEPAH